MSAVNPEYQDKSKPKVLYIETCQIFDNNTCQIIPQFPKRERSRSVKPWTQDRKNNQPDGDIVVSKKKGWCWFL